ncbi:MAG: phosphomannomutase/phosphoglucomutase [Acidimicrobiales bacterium]|nr:phosphomannomutase/phosphoglucomutase [Acidimicrobiaceae bacterium]MXV86440.1 phosphomannomutase/phosphoglucomutase [Acidimicrobiales bacterium]MXZ13953.1 phosphomannomutase/phosphoglucomutase [Acidimicrobiales bacterium]MYB81293.1 phosphomannomutase/phosphoglucomutase [Acidimicrobiales bacterium]MYI11572.1 phosphomannomutase/phosphoglucomutase [Acidimicrobiales bacterium]
MTARIDPVTAGVLANIVKAYDIRGICPEELSPSVARGIGYAFATWSTAPQIVMARDMRPSGVSLAEAFADGAQAAGADVIDIGLASTDLLYFASGHLGMPGAMLTASHNPASYNGIKLCGPGAAPVGADSGLDEIAERAAQGDSSPPGGGRRSRRDLLDTFAAHVRSFVDASGLGPLRVVADTANGMGGLVVPAVFDPLPFEWELMYGELDGTFPNHPADPIQPENLVDLSERVRSTGADVGLAFDGDADRVFLVDERGRAVSGSLLTALVAQAMLRRSGPGPILHNLICSRAVPEAIVEAGGQPVRTRVGHSFIKAEMARTGASFGGEHSGHYYFADNYRADSGLIAALIALEQLSAAQMPLSELLAPLDRYSSSGEINTRVADVDGVLRRVGAYFATFSQDWLDGLTIDGGDWWFNLRPSNTEPLLRLNLEAPDAGAVAERVSEITTLLA